MQGSADVTTADLHGFDALEEGWNALSAETGGPVEQFDWAVSCASTYPHERLCITTVSRHGQLVAVAPFAVKRARGVRRQIMLGVDDHHEPMDLLALDGPAIDHLARAVARARLPLEFGRLPADSPAIPALRRALRRHMVVTRSRPTTPYITLDASWEEPEGHLNSGRRSDIRRARRRAERLGPVTSEILAPGPEALEPLLSEAFAIEARSWKGEAGTAILSLPEEEAFIRRYAVAASRRGILRLCFLRIGDRRVAMQIAMIAGGGFWLLKVGYDAEFAKCSPGVLLLRDSLASAAAAGLSSFEFLGRNEPWIAQWTETERETVALHAYPRTPRGGLALLADAAFATAKATRLRSAKELPRIKRTVKRVAAPVLGRVARRYIAGESLGDALRVADRLAEEGTAATIGYWDSASDSPREVTDLYLAALDDLGARGRGEYLSIKLPALEFSADLFGEVVGRGTTHGVQVHLDSLGPETVERTLAAVDDALRTAPATSLGLTLPGRWERSVRDADWACERGLPVRVVKGEWPDPAEPHRDLRAGYLAVIDRLCGRAAHVAVATHDPWLAAEALGRLRDAGTPCRLELLYGLPMDESVRQARELGVAVRVYVPYGQAFLPYAISHLGRNPRLALWLARDLARSLRREPRRPPAAHDDSAHAGPGKDAFPDVDDP
jgi:CelD/BcsL family acetyltransferase involved in cellulose biosynthesis